MLIDMYQHYLYIIGKLKDAYQLSVDVNHRDIHTFYKEKMPIFKLLFGQYSGSDEPSIVVSFHIDLSSVFVVQWFHNIQQLHPPLKISEHFIEDDHGETWLGEDANSIRDLKYQQYVLEKWLSRSDTDEIKEFVDSKIVGRTRDFKKTYVSQTEFDEARIEFSKMKKPSAGEEVH
jgi:hypothetical protein